MSKENEIGTEVAVALRSNLQLAEVAPLEQFAKLKEDGTMIAQSGMFGSNISASGGALIAMTMYKENLSPVEFKRRYHIVKNTPSRVTNSLLGDFKLSGGKYRIVRNDDEVCEIEFTTRDGEKWTQKVEMAKYLKTDTPYTDESHRTLKSNWKNNPDDMLFARCCSKAIRRIAPELMGGVYTREEEEDIQADNVVEGTSRSPLDETAATERLQKLTDKVRVAKKSAAKKEESKAEVVEAEVVPKPEKTPVQNGDGILEKAKKEAEEKAKAELARKRKEKEEQERADAERAEAECRAAEAEDAQAAGKGGEGGAEAEDFTVCPIPGQMLNKKWSEMDTDVVAWAYLKTMEKYPQYIKQGHIDAMKAVLEERGALPEA